MRVRLLGPVDVVDGGQVRDVSGLRRKAVLATLALHRGRVVSTERLIEVAWEGSPPATALNSLQSTVSHLRGVLGGRDSIVARAPGYVLDLDADGTDVDVAERLVERASLDTDHTGRAALLREALTLWRGRPLADVAGLAWLDEQAARLDQLRLRATLALAESRMAVGEQAEVVPVLHELAGDHPLDEQLHAQLMLALYRAGRQAEALAVFDRIRAVLAEELGIDPGRALRGLHAAVLRQDAHLAGATGVPDSRRGTFGELRLGGPVLIGRHPELAALRERIAAAGRGAGGVAFVVGEAGLGKSRLALEAGRLAGAAGLRVLRGRAAAPPVQFRPLHEALLGLVRHDEPPQTRELAPYLPALARLVPEWRGHTRTDADDSPIVLAEALLRLLVHAGRPAGTVLILEDLHESDPDTLAVLDYLADNTAGEQLLIVSTLRPDPGEALKLANTAAQRRAATVIELHHLDGAAVRELAGLCLGVGAEQVPEAVHERLAESCDGVPLHVEELLAGMVGERSLVRDDDGWTVRRRLPTGVPETLAATLTARAGRLSPRTQRLLQAAALLGRRFPPAAAGAIAEMDEMELLSSLREAVEARILDGGGEQFRHALTADALRERLLPIERAALSRRAAATIGATEGWEPLVAELWLAAGDPDRAAAAFLTAAARAAAQGAIGTRITLLERALSLHPSAFDVITALIDGYADTGRIDDAYALALRVRDAPDPRQRAAVHLRMAQVAAAAGLWIRGLRDLAEARRLIGRPADHVTNARFDLLAARLTFGNPTPHRYAGARRRAERALRSARLAGDPDLICGALEMLGRCARLDDLAEADRLYERGLAVAEEHNLAGRRIGLLYHLGTDHGIRHGDPSRLESALATATASGAVVSALNIEIELCVVRICRAEYETASAAAARCEETAGRLRLTHTRLIALGVRIMAAAHRAANSDVDELMDRFRALGGEEDDFATAVRGFGLALHHLLNENPAAARAELDWATAHEASRPASYLSFVPGPELLTAVLDGTAGLERCAALARSAHAQAGWNQQFLLLSRAVLHGRAGRTTEADADARRFFDLSRRYPLAHHLGLRLAAPEAATHGWGTPHAWTRSAATYFRDTAPAVSRACSDPLVL
ncbi:BTAD domain-containing putative transcriptional regulator [Winogradskya humida]|nr:BTAD domain-containing putative transcriptional regulator [Actinoplanes humidus]